MKINRSIIAALLLGLVSCQKKTDMNQESWVKETLDVASYQLELTANELADSAKLPRSVWAGYDIDFLTSQLERSPDSFQKALLPNPSVEITGKRHLTDIYDWTSGFFPGSLWYAYEMTKNEKLKEQAIQYTNLLNPIRSFKDTHDLGFMINCSFGNALRLAPNDSIKSIIVETADNLCARFNPEIGCIRSWDFGLWNFPVIIDNMMNLDLLFNATRLTGDSTYYRVAVKHAQTTMKHHFRPDYTSYHVISYNNDGTVESKGTYQGKNDGSAWSRGQAWAVYGYTSCYCETKDTAFLQEATNIADMIMKRVTTDDCIPYWDYDAPAGKSTPRDASAAAITASALLELSTLAPEGKKYFDYAETILKNLSSDKYLAMKGSNQGFVLMHSTGSLPHGSEIDVPLNYADYYYLEALQRYRNLTK